MLALFLFSFISPLTLEIKINGLKNNQGQILLEFQDEKTGSIKGFSQEIVNNQCIITIDNLSPGKYTFKYFHDENSNEKIDVNWLGIPKEGYGFSNNAKGTFGPPSHEKMIFELTADTTINCTPTYINQ